MTQPPLHMNILVSVINHGNIRVEVNGHCYNLGLDQKPSIRKGE